MCLLQVMVDSLGFLVRPNQWSVLFLFLHNDKHLIFLVCEGPPGQAGRPGLEGLRGPKGNTGAFKLKSFLLFSQLV